MVPLSYVKNFARCVQNFHHQDVVDQQRDSKNQNKPEIGRLNENGLIVYTPAEIETISKKYRNLFANRIDQVMETKKQKYQMKSLEKQKIPSYAHRPELNAKSIKYAQQAQTNTPRAGIPIQDRLIQFKDILEKKKEDLTLIYEEEENKNLIFNPNMHKQTGRPVNPKKWDELHSRVYDNPKLARMDLTEDEVQF